MKSFTLTKLSILLLGLMLAMVMFGCSGGSGDGLAGGGIGGTGITVASVGTATGFGSVIVNGATYDTSTAEVYVENISKGVGDLSLVQNISVGMVVRVEGRLTPDGSSIADRIFFSNDLRGPVESIRQLDPVSKQVVILGQTVLIDDRTSFRNMDAASIAVGIILEVSGFADESGSIVATYINKVSDSLSAGSTVEIKGMVQNLDSQWKTFKINLLTIDYSAADVSELAGGGPETGQLLKVRGKLQEPSLLVAERLESDDTFGTGDFDTVDLEGIITQTNSPSEFRIRQYTVTVDSETVYKNLKPADLNRGTHVIVRGTMINRSILADEIQLPEDVRLESNLSSIDLVESRLVFSGLESVLARTNATTRIIGNASELDGILLGDHVRLLGRRTMGGEILASNLLITPSAETVELSGSVESVTEPIIVILGIQVNTASIPSDRFKGFNGSVSSSSDFFDIVKTGDAVAGWGTLYGGIVNWTDIKLE